VALRLGTYDDPRGMGVFNERGTPVSIVHPGECVEESGNSAEEPERVWKTLKVTTHLHHISHCKATPGTNWSNRWTYRVFIKTSRRD
jgi:hypothetical protein